MSELKPCPFCGALPINYHQWTNSAYGTCDCGAGYRKSANENAWCWKEIERLEKLIEKRRDELYNLREAWGDRFLVQELDAREIENLKAELAAEKAKVEELKKTIRLMTEGAKEAK